jgi:UDP-glucose 4-epimerase/UDP-glucuronate decarboxylase
LADNILITGGAGFIGYHLAKRLVASGHRVTLLDNFFRGKADSELKSLLKHEDCCELVTGDLTGVEVFEKLHHDYSQVYHLAALMSVKYATEIPHKMLRDNIISTINILDWFAKKGTGKILLSSTSETYSTGIHPLPVPTPENVPLVIDDVFNPRYSYKGSKIVSEMLFASYARAYNIDMSIVRYHNIYGPRMGYEHVIPELSVRILNREEPFKVFSPEQTRAFCYVEDAIDATLKVMSCPQARSQIVNIGNDTEEIKIKDLAVRLLDIAGYHPAVEYLPPPSGSPDRRCPDINKLKKLTGFQPAVSLNEGLSRTFMWYESRYKDKGSSK